MAFELICGEVVPRTSLAEIIATVFTKSWTSLIKHKLQLTTSCAELPWSITAFKLLLLKRDYDSLSQTMNIRYNFYSYLWVHVSFRVAHYHGRLCSWRLLYVNLPMLLIIIHNPQTLTPPRCWFQSISPIIRKGWHNFGIVTEAI